MSSECRNRIGLGKRSEFGEREGVRKGEKKKRDEVEMLGKRMSKRLTRGFAHNRRASSPCTRDQGRNLAAKGPRCEQREYIITMSSRLLGEPFTEVS